MYKYIFRKIRQFLVTVGIAYDVYIIYYKLYKNTIKYTVFIIIVSLFIVMLNFFVFREVLNVNNNVCLLAMIIMSRFISFILKFIYDEIELFRSVYINKSKIYEKVKSLIKKNTSFESVITTVLHFSICIKLKDLIVFLLSFNTKNATHLCLLALLMLIISSLSKYIISRLIKHLKDKFK